MATLTILFAAAGCSGGGTLNSATPIPTAAPTATGVPVSGTAKSITLAQNGAAPAQGIPGTFTLTAAEYDVHGKLITGTYPEPIVVTVNDSTDLTLAPLPSGGSAGGSVTISNSQTVALVSYNGAAVPAGTQFAASAQGIKSVTAPFAPNKTGAGPGQVETISIAEAGAPPYLGSPGEFALAITAYDLAGNPISGSYTTPIVVTTNDSADLQLSTVQNVPGTASVSVPNAQTTVFVTYDGKTVPNGTVLSAFSGTASNNLSFNPPNLQAPPPTISRLAITRNGEDPTVPPSLAVFPIFVTAYDQNGNAIAGTLPNAVNVTLNETCDLSLSLGGSGSVSPCIVNGKPVSVNNNGAVIINNTSQVVFLNYDGINVIPGDTALSATTLSNVCEIVSFPGNQPEPCVGNSNSRVRKVLHPR